MEQIHLPDQLGQPGQFMPASASRRKFIRLAGISGVAATVFTGCVKSIANVTQDGKGPTNAVPLGNGDTGLLNYAFALEQLQAAYYMAVVADPYENIPSLEYSRVIDIRDHEIAHRELFRTILGKNAIQDLTFNFKNINFSSRALTLAAARTIFEDLVVSAYNGAGTLWTNPDYLGITAKIASVEARHSAWFRNLILPGSFADQTVVHENGLELSRTPAAVLAIAQPFITEKLDGSALPNA